MGDKLGTKTGPNSEVSGDLRSPSGCRPKGVQVIFILLIPYKDIIWEGDVVVVVVS